MPATVDPSPAVTSPAATPTATPSPTPEVRTIAIKLADGKASPNGTRVNLVKGEKIILDITSDRDDEVHIHGFDKEIPVKAGKRVKAELVADRTGRYEVESHHPELLILVLQVR